MKDLGKADMPQPPCCASGVGNSRSHKSAPAQKELSGKNVNPKDIHSSELIFKDCCCWLCVFPRLDNGLLLPPPPRSRNGERLWTRFPVQKVYAMEGVESLVCAGSFLSAAQPHTQGLDMGA